MEIFIFIVLVVVGYLIYAFVKSSEPFLRKDIEPVDESIPLSQGKDSQGVSENKSQTISIKIWFECKFT